VLTRVETELAFERGRLRNSQAGLAQALALSLDTVEKINITQEPVSRSSQSEEPAVIRASALRNRLDVHESLYAFGAADAEVKLAVAAQYPELSLSPSYFWDQGDSVWSLAAGLIFPPGLRGTAAIKEAEARRELAAQRFIALQLRVIGEAERAGHRLAVARSLTESATRQGVSAREQVARMERRFERGNADRLELTAARIAAAYSADVQRDAAGALLRALAALEDAIQEPVLNRRARIGAAPPAGAVR
jgi:outer membrane protein, heavy metal efflux system